MEIRWETTCQATSKLCTCVLKSSPTSENVIIISSPSCWCQQNIFGSSQQICVHSIPLNNWGGWGTQNPKLIWKDVINTLCSQLSLCFPFRYFQFVGYSDEFSLKKGVNGIFSNQFGTLGLQETWIMSEKLCGAILCLFFFSTHLPQLCRRMLSRFSCWAPGMFSGRPNFPSTIEVRRQWLNFHFWVDSSVNTRTKWLSPYSTLSWHCGFCFCFLDTSHREKVESFTL